MLCITTHDWSGQLDHTAAHMQTATKSHICTSTARDWYHLREAFQWQSMKLDIDETATA